jgi:hypothetical protein
VALPKFDIAPYNFEAARPLLMLFHIHANGHRYIVFLLQKDQTPISSAWEKPAQEI